MKFTNAKQIQDFLEAVNQCNSEVYLISPEGDRFNLKSSLSQYVAIGALLGERGDYLELFCNDRVDESYLMKFLYEHPEV